MSHAPLSVAGLGDSKFLLSSQLKLYLKLAMSYTLLLFQVESSENLMEFVDLVSYCAHKFRAAGDMYCAKVSKKLNEMAAIFSEVFLLSLACKPASTYSIPVYELIY